MYQRIRLPLICGFGALASLILGITNDRGLVIEHYGELSTSEATIFYWLSFIVFTSIAVFTARRIGNSATLGKGNQHLSPETGGSNSRI